MKVEVKTITVYTAEDGQEFDSKYDCIKHELIEKVCDRTGIYRGDVKDVISVVLENLADFNALSNT